MTSLSGLNDGDFTNIDVVYTISINGDQGSNNQVLTSNGDTTEYKSITGSMISLDDLTATGGTILIGGSDTGSYDGSVARSIAVAKVPNALTAGTNITFSSGTTYDGSSAITINATDTDNQLVLSEGSGIVITDLGGFNRRIATNIDADTIVFDGSNKMEVAKVPNALTAGTNISFSSGTTYDGSSAITINATDTNTQLNLTAGNGIEIANTGGVNRTISAKPDEDTIDFDGTELTVLKVPEGLSAGTNLSYTSGSTFDGETARTINLASAPTNLDLSSSTNIIHPPNVFEVSGDLRMSIEMGNFFPNDDNSFFNIGVEDDFSTNIHGSLKVLTSSLEVCGYFIIPNNYTATGVRIDATDASGSSISRTIMCASITTYGGTGYTSLNFSGNTGSEFSLSPTMDGASDKIMLITIFTTSTSDHIRGGYIKLTRGDDY
tara:strand:- start:11483 stop:12790 length:1308 start_codon:yes stop_codon:yes gene_type:complete